MLRLDFPRDSDTHTLADFIELLCLITPDRFCSRDYVTDYVRDVSEKRLEDGALDDAFAQLAWRTSAFGNAYPFSLDAHGRVLSASNDLTAAQIPYALLLLCANLPFVQNRGEMQELTDAFERASLQALRRLWPVGAVVRKFGRNQAEYTGAKWERLNALSRDIGGQAVLTSDTFRERDRGDGGVDVAAWFDLDIHEKLNIPSALGQCACSRDEWSVKQSSISGARLGIHLRPTHPWMELIFIPHSFRNNLGKWAVPGDLGQAIVMDRLRILNNLHPDEDWPEINAPAAFENFLEMRLDLV
jgi:hypothetical protein